MVFAWPGLGLLAAEAAGRRDYPLVMGASLLAAGHRGHREPADRSGVRAARSQSALLVTPMLDALAGAWRSPRGRTGALALAVIAAAALVGPFLLPDPLAQPCVLTCKNLPPSLAHPLGTDDLSRDILVAGGERRADLPVGRVSRGRSLGDAGRSAGARRRLLGRRGGYGADAPGRCGAFYSAAVPAAPGPRGVGDGARRRADPADRHHRLVRNRTAGARRGRAAAGGGLRAGGRSAGREQAAGYLPAPAPRTPRAHCWSRPRWGWET